MRAEPVRKGDDDHDEHVYQHVLVHHDDDIHDHNRHHHERQPHDAHDDLHHHHLLDAAADSVLRAVVADGAFSCIVETSARCAGRGGIAQGAGTCSPDPCPTTTTTSMVPTTVPTTVPNYVVTDLGTLGGTRSEATGINASGEVVGYSDTVAGGNPNQHGFIYSRAVMTDIGTLGGTCSSAFGINDAGQVVGDACLPGNLASHAFVYSGGAMTDLGTLGGTSSHAFAINDSAAVVGWSDLAGDMAQHAFLWNAGTMSDLGTLGGSYSRATAISAPGDIVGVSTLDLGVSFPFEAFLYSGGVMTALPTRGACSANGISLGGQIVGFCFFPGYIYSHAVLWRDGVIIDLDPSGRSGQTIASGINAAGQVVGSLAAFEGAFLYSAGSMVDLNTLIPSGSGWLLRNASAINDSSEVVGFGDVGGQTHAFLLTPVALGAGH